MSHTKFIKPAPGYAVRMPNGNVLPAEGAEVELNSYWLRRMDDGDVVPASKPKTNKDKE